MSTPPCVFFPFSRTFAFGRAPGKFPSLRFVYFSSDSQNRVRRQPWVAFLAPLPAAASAPLTAPASPPNSPLTSAWLSHALSSTCNAQCLTTLPQPSVPCPPTCPIIFQVQLKIFFLLGCCSSSPTANSLFSSPAHFIFLMRHIWFMLLFHVVAVV